METTRLLVDFPIPIRTITFYFIYATSKNKNSSLINYFVDTVKIDKYLVLTNRRVFYELTNKGGVRINCICKMNLSTNYHKTKYYTVKCYHNSRIHLLR